MRKTPELFIKTGVFFCEKNLTKLMGKTYGHLRKDTVLILVLVVYCSVVDGR